MLNEYDYDEEAMKEGLSAISVPLMAPPMISARL